MGGESIPEQRELDDWDRLAAANRDPVEESGKRTSLGLIVLQVERTLGSGFVYDRRRWGTTDGYIPYRVLVAAYQGLPALWALERLQMARAVNLGQAGEQGRSALAADAKLANGER